MNRISCLLFVFSALISCNREIVQEKGGIDILTTIYFNASRNLDDLQAHHVSKLNFSNDTIIELVPNLYDPTEIDKIHFIKDTFFYDLSPLPEALRTNLSGLNESKMQSVYNKSSGAVFSKDRLPDYNQRKDISDTILINKAYMRFDVDSEELFMRYYIYRTDTLLPYTMFQHTRNDYKGRIERIDTYNKAKDLFVTIQLIPRKEWDEEAKEIFEYNRFIKSRK